MLRRQALKSALVEDERARSGFSAFLDMQNDVGSFRDVVEQCIFIDMNCSSEAIYQRP
jgi:hypothetical protein